MKSNKKTLIALGTGLIIGSLLGVLFAPRKGRETRKKIADTGKDVADKINDTISHSKDVLSGLKD